MFRKTEPAQEEKALKIIHSYITPELAWDVLKKLDKNRAPSQTIEYTRAPIINDLVFREGTVAGFAANFKATGNIVVTLTNDNPRFWFFSHADEISYLFKDRLDDKAVVLAPFCAHRAKAEYKATGLRFDSDPKGRVVAYGSIRTMEINSAHVPVFFSSEGSIQPGDRVVYHHPLTKMNDLLYGQLDNPAGVAACILAILALKQLKDDLSVGFVFTDEEEGPSESNATFARGAKRLRDRISIPELCVVVDGHDVASDDSISRAALYAEKSSNCRGTVVPPHLYNAFRKLLDESEKTGIEVKENTGYVSRSDDVACYEMTKNVLLVGYAVNNPHFNLAVPTASLRAIVNLSKIIAWIALHA